MTTKLRADVLAADIPWLGMPMADVRVGMRLRSTVTNACGEEIEVTEITERGFKYRIPDDKPVVDPHWSMPMLRDGHEHFGVGGRSTYVPVAT